MKAFVNVTKVENPCDSAYEAARAVVKEDVAGKKVLLKPNTGFDGEPKTGLSTHPELVRGVIRFFKDRGASEVIVGDSSVIGINSLQALKSAGIYQVCSEENVTCMDLNESGPIEKKIPDGYLIDSILLSRILFEVDIIVCLPVMKTHMHTGATLSIKNMKGGMYKREKNKLHRISKPVPQGRSERSLDYGIRDLTRVLYPDYAITDGIIGMEGFGPSGGTPKPFGIITSSASPVACDMITMQLMGLGPDDVGHVKLVAQERGITYDDIEVSPSDYLQWAQHFKTPAEARLDLSCDNLEYIDESACSACHATLTQFLRYHADKFQEGKKISIFAGKDLDRDEIISKGDSAYLVGNCTAKFRDLAPFCKGCPPVTSEILKMVLNMYGVTINNFGNGSFLLQTMNYRLAINPESDLEGIKTAKPTHICVTGDSDSTAFCALKLAKEFNSELYIPQYSKVLSESDHNAVSGKANEPIKTEFGYVKFSQKADTKVEINIENLDLYFSFAGKSGVDEHSGHMNVAGDAIGEAIGDATVIAAYDLDDVTIIINATKEKRRLGKGDSFTCSSQSGNGKAVDNASIGFKGVL